MPRGKEKELDKVEVATVNEAPAKEDKPKLILPELQAKPTDFAYSLVLPDAKVISLGEIELGQALFYEWLAQEIYQIRKNITG